jgi:hypothetical protein
LVGKEGAVCLPFILTAIILKGHQPLTLAGVLRMTPSGKALIPMKPGVREEKLIF